MFEFITMGWVYKKASTADVYSTGKKSVCFLFSIHKNFPKRVKNDLILYLVHYLEFKIL